MGTYLYHTSCPVCGSKDNVAVYSDGYHCHTPGCTYSKWDKDAKKPPAPKKKTFKKKEDFFLGGYEDLIDRGISEETCRFWGYKVGYYENTDHTLTPIHIANHHSSEGELVGQKLRTEKKNFKVIGDIATLYGKWLWSSGKYIVITEGELDALAVSQIHNNKYPVVSIPHGSDSAEKYIRKDLKWLEDNFEKIVLMFDQDKAGKTAVDRVAPMFTPGKCFVAKLSEKDPCDMLLAGKVQELARAVFTATPFRPDGVVTFGEVEDRDIEHGLSYPFQTLTDLTYGIRPQELYTLGAGTGVGKTELLKEFILHLRQEHDQKVGVIFLEETNNQTKTSLIGKAMSKPIHIPEVEYTAEEYQDAYSTIGGKNGEDLVLYNHFGYMDYASIKSTIRHMVVGMGCKYIFLDHVTALVSGDKDGDERKTLDYICTNLASMLRELDFTLFMVSHLATASGQPHEEGGRVQLKHLRGSRAIGQWSSYVFALERDQQDEDQFNQSTFRILKDRYTGQATGRVFELYYNSDTGRLTEHEIDAKDIYNVEERQKAF